MTNAFQYFFNEIHEAVVEDCFIQLYVPEMSLALSSLSASLAFLIKSAHSQTEVVGAYMNKLEMILPRTGLFPS